MTSKILILGEAWNDDEDHAGESFTGSLGSILNGMLRQVGIDRAECHVTSVFKIRPRPTLKVENLCGKKFEGITGRVPYVPGKYVLEKYEGELERLDKEIEAFGPNVIVALGKTAAWATLGTSKINSVRGVAAIGRHGCKVVPTYNPTAIRANWSNRPVVLADLTKALAQSFFPELIRIPRELWIKPSYEDLLFYEENFINPSDELSIDIETAGEQITCIGFAPSITSAIVVPFYDRKAPGNNYWKSLNKEVEVMQWVRKMCGLPKATIVGQNFLYDIKYLLVKYGIPVPSFSDDTMLLTHAQQPEMQKGLGFLASIHTNEGSWKFMRTKYTGKKED